MLLKPRYGADPIISLDGDPSAVALPAIVQRRRLAEVVSDFTEAEWAHQSRCEGWSNRDVISHLNSTNFFWAMSIQAGLDGSPTTFMESFDPAVSPDQLVAGEAGKSTGEVLSAFLDTTETLCALLDGLAPEDWQMLAEAPPGHLSVSAVAHHALWDSWVHERDILLPLGLTPVEANDEVLACLRYAAALGPSLALSYGKVQEGSMGVDVDDLAVSFSVVTGSSVSVRSGKLACDFRIEATAVALLEALSQRSELDLDPPEDHAWMLDGLVQAFTVEDSTSAEHSATDQDQEG